MGEPPDVRTIPKPQGLASIWVRAMLSLAVGAVIPLAPLLGKADVPGFTALLSLYPVDLKRTILPVSSFLCGIAAAAVQFMGAARPSVAFIRRCFAWSLVCCLVSLVALIPMYNSAVVVLPFAGAPDGATHDAAFSVGFAPQPRGAICREACRDKDPEACIKDILGADLGAIASCYGGSRIKSADSLLELDYLALIGGLGALVGATVLQRSMKKKGV